MKQLFQFWLIPIFLLNFLDVAKTEVATTMKIVKITRTAATIIIRIAEAGEDTTIKVIITNSKAASKDIPVSIVDLLVMEIIWEAEAEEEVEAGGVVKDKRPINKVSFYSVKKFGISLRNF